MPRSARETELKRIAARCRRLLADPIDPTTRAALEALLEETEAALAGDKPAPPDRSDP